MWWGRRPPKAAPDACQAHDCSGRRRHASPRGTGLAGLDTQTPPHRLARPPSPWFPAGSGALVVRRSSAAEVGRRLDDVDPDMIARRVTFPRRAATAKGNKRAKQPSSSCTLLATRAASVLLSRAFGAKAKGLGDS